MALVLGVGWGVLAPVLPLLTDGIPTADYEGFSTAINAVLLVILVFVMPVASLGTWGLVVRDGERGWRALAVAQLPGIAATGALLLLLLRT